MPETENPIVTRAGDRWTVRYPYDQRHIPRTAGFRWDATARCWYTRSRAIAAKLGWDGAEPPPAIAPRHKPYELRPSLGAWPDAWDPPVPAGLSLLPFQRHGVRELLRRGSALLADEMGLGKTCQAVVAANASPGVSTALVICPATVKINWAREIARWSTRPHRCHILQSAPTWGYELPEPPAGGISWVILNYDIAARWKAALQKRYWDLLVLDEAHYCKNPKSARTTAILGRRYAGTAVDPIRAARKYFLTGTPILNRPIELWPLLNGLVPKEFGAFFQFGTRYAGGLRGAYGLDFSGATHLDELRTRLNATVLIRRLKRDVLPELPPIRRSIVALPAAGAPRDWHGFGAAAGESYDDAARRLRSMPPRDAGAMAIVRHKLALAKVPHIARHVRDVLDAEPKAVLFMHHRDPIARLRDELREFDPVLITGETPPALRQRAVDRFQGDPACRLFIGNIQAAGVGITLTASSHVIFGELDWTPGAMEQAEARCHRIGTQADMVLVEHLVYDGSLDAYMVQLLLAKQATIRDAMDGSPAVTK